MNHAPLNWFESPLSPMPLSPKDLLLVAIMPGVLALVLLALGRRIWQRRELDPSDPARGAWAGPLAVGLAFLVVFPTPSVMAHLPHFPPAESVEWLFIVALCATLLGIVDSWARRVGWVRALSVLLLALACSMFTLKFKLAQWTTSQRVESLGCVSLITMFTWAALDWSERDPDSYASAPLAFLLLSMTAATVLATGSLKHAQLAGSISAACGAASLLAIVCRRPSLVRGTAIPLAVLHVMLIVGAATLFSDFDRRYTVALLTAPLLIALGRAIPVTKMPPIARPIIRLLPLAILCGILLARVIPELKHQALESGETGGDEMSMLVR
jgi:hypothetical protein